MKVVKTCSSREINKCYSPKVVNTSRNGDAEISTGAVKKYADIGLHLPDMQTLANIAGALYGKTDIGVNTFIMANGAHDVKRRETALCW